MLFTLELRDLPYKIDETVRETVQRAVQVALQAPLRDRFKDLSEEDMKEMLHQRMFESGSYKSLPKHIKQRLEWLKPIPEEDRPATPKPDWSILTNDPPEPENN
ncbi:hypothetical protein Tco_0298294 [Tanacetum coccineum]